MKRAVPASRAHLESALTRLSPASIGVPPGALLLVRRLAPRAPLGAGARGNSFVADVQEVLRERLAHARTPGLAGDEDDLLFRDNADLAAAVIASWLDGSPLPRRTWQRVVTGGEPPPAWWRRAVLPDARLLPRVVAALTRQARIMAWIAQLDPAEVRQATYGLAAAHGIAPLEPAGAPGALATAPPLQVAAVRALRKELALLVPEAMSAELAEPARAFLVLALVLDRRPGLVRSEIFATALAALIARPARPPRTDGLRPQHDAAAESARGDIMPAEPPARQQRVVTSPSPRHSLQSTKAVPVTSPRDAAIQTDFGGLFFLLNALIALDIYGDFTRPLAILRAPAPFDLLALLGRRWFGRRFQDDPIRPFLAALAGRDPSTPLRFTPPPWHIPDAWLAPWPPAPADLAWHPAGFPFTTAVSDTRLPRTPGPRWIAALALYLQARLARALDADGRTAVRLTCRQHASVTCTGDSVTLTFALADHPLALRFAGLDRDPGYIPAARREVAFVFA